MKNNEEKIWISWENHRRSRELASALSASYYPLLERSTDIHYRSLRYLMLSIKTFLIIFKRRPKIVFCQNPSVFLAFILSVLKKPFKYYLIVDRHSNFKIGMNKGLKWKVFHLFSKYSIKKADLTIVTNLFLCKVVNEMGGLGFVLQDRLPKLELGKKIKLKGRQNIACVTTFSPDEPILEIVKAACSFGEETEFYLTGNFKKYIKMNELDRIRPSNVSMTGYLSEKDYQSLLTSSDLVIVLTTEENLLTCGAYEAYSIGVPLVLSDTCAIREYFRFGAIYTKNTVDGIAGAVKEGLKKKNELKEEMLEFREKMVKEWRKNFLKLEKIIDSSIKIKN